MVSRNEAVTASQRIGGAVSTSTARTQPDILATPTSGVTVPANRGHFKRGFHPAPHCGPAQNPFLLSFTGIQP